MSRFLKVHFRANKDSRLSELFTQNLDDDARSTSLPFENLLSLGSIYVNDKRTYEDIDLKVDDFVKAHLQPRRYLFENLSFKPKTIFENEEFVVVDKPSPLPTHATAANGVENLISYLEKETGKKYYVTSRLDVDTEGLIVLAKSKQAQASLNDLFKKSLIKKIYRGISASAPEPGIHRHYQSPETGPTREFDSVEHPDWKICEMKIHHIEKVKNGFLSEIELITGRTHQIRGQMVLLECPLLGDTLYGGPQHSRLELECFSLQFTFKGTPYLFRRA